MKHMKSAWALAGPLIAAALLLVVLLAVHALDRSERGAAAAFQPLHTRQLNDENLVDVLSGLPLHHRIGRADWDSGSLAIDIKMKNEPITVREVYEDIASLLSYSFEGTDNVDQLYLRVIAVDRWGGKRYLLLAANMSRSEWSAEYADSLQSLDGFEVPEALAASLHMTVTDLWLRQFSRPGFG